MLAPDAVRILQSLECLNDRGFATREECYTSEIQPFNLFFLALVALEVFVSLELP